MQRPHTSSSRGASLIEVAVVLVVVAILGSGIGLALSSLATTTRSSAVLAQLDTIKAGLIGYVSDMGGFPSPANLAALVNSGSQPDFAVSPTLQMGTGWRGPYIPDNALVDPWGNAIVLTVAAGTSAVTGAPVAATLRSWGPDGINGTPDDSVAEIYRREVFSEVIGYVKNRSYATLPGISVNLSIASSGAIATASSVTDSDGRYQFTNVPQGRRVLLLGPRLSYRAGTAFATGGNRDEVEFVIENLGKDAATFNNFRVNYVSEPQGYFRRVTVNGNQVRNTNSPRHGSGLLITFNSPYTAGFSLPGSGISQEPISVVVRSLTSQLPDAFVSAAGTASSHTIRLEDFDDVPTGNGSPVDMSGVTFEVVFSDGSITLFTTVMQ